MEKGRNPVDNQLNEVDGFFLGAWFLWGADYL
jgi:hypothetical protein